MKEVEVDNLNLVEDRDDVGCYSVTGTTTYAPGLTEFRLELTKISPPDELLSKIHNADSLLVISEYGCIKTDNFVVGDYIFGTDKELEVELTLVEEPLYAKNKEQLLLDII